MFTFFELLGSMSLSALDRHVFHFHVCRPRVATADLALLRHPNDVFTALATAFGFGTHLPSTILALVSEGMKLL
jgi:hypothetical protein